MSIINVHHENSLLTVENLGLKNDLAALRDRLAAAEELSESRRVTLLAKSEELAAEWKRAEAAEALVRELAAVAKMARDLIVRRAPAYFNSGADDESRDWRTADAALAALSPAARKETEG